jgi:hypothetical protein
MLPRQFRNDLKKLLHAAFGKHPRHEFRHRRRRLIGKPHTRRRLALQGFNVQPHASADNARL